MILKANRSPDRRTSNRPHPAPRDNASDISLSASCGRCVSACRNNNISPSAFAAPAFICAALPLADGITVAICDATATVSSVLPPSTTRTSASSIVIDSSVCVMLSASSSTGIMIDKGHPMYQPSAPPQLLPCPAVQP